MECYCYLPAIWRTIQRALDSFLFDDGVPTDLCQRPVKTPPVWQASSTRNLPWICIVRGRTSRQETFGSQTWRSWKIWTRQKSMPGDSMRRNCELTPRSGEKFIFPIADETVKLSGRDQFFFFRKIHPNPGLPCTRRTAYRCQGKSDGSQPSDT